MTRTEGNGDSIHVLHVDDDPDFGDVVATFLERESNRFEVETATNASDGLDRLAANDFDCVVSDYDMPGQNGIEFLETVREESADLPFILYTGKGSEEVASEAISAGVTDYLQKGGDTSQYAVLANRITNAVEQYRANQRAAEMDRIRSLASAITQELVHAESRETLETRLCETLTDTDPYVFAWIGEVNQNTTEIEPRASAGTEAGYLDEITVTTDESATAQGPTGRAVRERELVTTQSIPDEPDYEPWRDNALGHGFRSSAAIPLVHDETLYGVLNLYSDEERSFDEAERELLAELGEDIAHTLHSLEMQAQLRVERDRRDALFKNAPGPVIAGEIHEEGTEYRITDVNRAFENVFGYEAAEVVGKDVADVVVPEQGMERHKEFRERAAAGKPSTAEVERLTTDGPREFLLHIIPYGMEGKGTNGWYAWYTDITKRKEREQQLRLMEQIVQEMNDGAVIVQDGAIQYTNPTVSKLVGYSEDELTDRSMGEFIAPEYRETVQERHQARLRGDDDDLLEMYEIEILSRDGPRIPVEIHVSRIEYDGQPATLSLVRDISERKEREQKLERRNERLEEFAGIVSHDLRNPLNVAMGRLELARDECTTKHLDAVAQAHDRMEGLIEDLLALAREGKKVTDPKPIDLDSLVESCWRTVETGDTTLVVEIDRTIRAERSRLAQLLENLFRNAVDHGGEDVTIRVGELDSGFYVADDGPGIPADKRERIFNSGYSMTGEGTGFGLAIVKEIAEAHDWGVSVTESRDGGARFEITGVDFVE